MSTDPVIRSTMTSMLDHLITLDPATPMGRCLAQWERVVEGEHDALADVLTDDFKVMVRPARAVGAVKAMMLAALEEG